MNHSHLIALDDLIDKDPRFSRKQTKRWLEEVIPDRLKNLRRKKMGHALFLERENLVKLCDILKIDMCDRIIIDIPADGCVKVYTSQMIEREVFEGLMKLVVEGK